MRSHSFDGLKIRMIEFIEFEYIKYLRGQRMEKRTHTKKNLSTRFDTQQKHFFFYARIFHFNRMVTTGGISTF